MKRTPDFVVARLVAFLLVLLFWSPIVLANGIVRDSIGAVSSGRGGANVSHSDNLAILNDNPAGLAWVDDTLLFEFSGDFLIRNVHYRDPLGSDEAENRLFFLPQVSIAGRLPNSQIRLGLTAVMPGGYGARYTLNHNPLGLSDYRSEGMLLKILPTVALPLGDRVSIGGGIGLGYGRTELRMPYTFQATPGLAGGFGTIDMDADGFGVTWNAGIQVKATDRLTFGVSYISETLLEQEGDFFVNAPALAPANIANYDVDANITWPRSFALGGNYEFDFGRLSFDTVWYNWSDAFEKFRFRLSNGDNPTIDGIAGPEPYDEFPLNWDDSVSLRLGYEHFFCERKTVVRLGYTWNLNPIPDGTATPLLPGILEHTVTIGLGHDFGPVKLDVAYQWAIADNQTVGVSDILGPGGTTATSDFNFSEMRAQAHWLFVTMMARF